MNPIQLADRYLGPYVTKGNEIVPDHCPFCGGGDHHDKGTFALSQNPDKGYNCKRGTCAATGAFFELCQHFGEQADSELDYLAGNQPRQYVKKVKDPLKEVKINPITPVIEKYLVSRGIDKDTALKLGIGENNGNIVFVYKENGKPVLYKFKIPRKPKVNPNTQKKELKSWQSGGGKSTLWHLDDADPKKGPLVIIEGEPDCAMLTAIGVPNVVSVPFGSEDMNWIENNWSRLENFGKIIIWRDNDPPQKATGIRAGEKWEKTLVVRLGEDKTWVCESPYKDASVHWFKEGPESVLEVIKNAHQLPIADMLNAADVEDFDPSKLICIPTGFDSIDRYIGGLVLGGTSLIPGKSGAGKSTVINTFIANALDNGFNTAVYSGELTAAYFRYWLELTLAGRENIETKEHNNKPDTHFISTFIKKRIRSWFDNRLHIYDNTKSTDAYEVLKRFEETAKRYGTKLFIIDNLMTLWFKGGANNELKAHSQFVQELAKFAKKFDAHVCLLAHPRKVYERMKREDIKGTGDIYNAVDTVIAVHRLGEADYVLDESLAEFSTMLEIFKNRIFSVVDKTAAYHFEIKSKRFWNSKSDVDKSFGWEKSEQISLLEQEGFKDVDATTPFE